LLSAGPFLPLAFPSLFEVKGAGGRDAAAMQTRLGWRGWLAPITGAE